MCSLLIQCKTVVKIQAALVLDQVNKLKIVFLQPLHKAIVMAFMTRKYLLSLLSLNIIKGTTFRTKNVLIFLHVKEFVYFYIYT